MRYALPSERDSWTRERSSMPSCKGTPGICVVMTGRNATAGLDIHSRHGNGYAHGQTQFSRRMGRTKGSGILIMDCPRIVIAGTQSGVGKTSLTLAIVTALRKRGL